MSEAPTHSPAMKFLAWIVMAGLRWQRGGWTTSTWVSPRPAARSISPALGRAAAGHARTARGGPPMTKTIVCFGDSNTYGTPPLTDLEDSRRFDPKIRWPGVMGDTLGPQWRVVEEGLPGRTT